MNELKENWGEIKQHERRLLAMMIFLTLLAVALLVFSLVSLKPGSPVVKVSYGDIGRYQGGEWSSMSNAGGYHDGSWLNMLAFPVLAVVFGFFHNVLVVKLYGKRGVGMAKTLAMISIGLLILAFVVLFRLLGEG